MGRAPCCDKANVKKGPWSPEEDAKLKEYIEENGTGGNWIALPQRIGLKRCGKSCRLRWLNYLRPNIKHGGFSEEEDQIICSLYISIGSRWSIIANQLPGRTDNDIKNYWNTRLKKKLLGKRKEQSQSRRGHSRNQEHSSGSSGSTDHQETLSSTALERMQIHLQLQGLHNPFAFYNNPALWPNKFYPLGNTTDHFQGQQNAVFEPAQKSSLPIKAAVNDTNCLPMNASMQENFNGSLNFNSMAELGLQADLQSLIYDNNGGIAQLGSFQGNAKDNMNWWAGNGFDESSSSSWDSASGAGVQPVN